MNTNSSGNNETKIMNLFKSEGFNQSPLASSNLVIYKKLMNEVFLSMQNSKKVKAIESLSKSYNLLFKELKQQNKTVNISYLTKKAAIMHGFIYNMARRQIQLGAMASTIETDLAEIKDEIKMANAKESKRSNTISKIYSYIRDISSSKEKIVERNKGKLNLEKQDDKGALREIMNKILIPFTSYLGKLISNFKDYSKILNGKAGEKSKEYMWKMANWSHIFDEVIKELMRVGHYFRQDVIGMQVMLSYVVALDLSVYYDFSEAEIEKESLNINDYKVDASIEKRRELEVYEKIEQLKLLIKESSMMKQILSNIFCNEQLVQWRKHFSKSQYFNYELSHASEQSAKDILLEFIGRLSRRKEKERKRSEKKQAAISSQRQVEDTYQQLIINKQNRKEEIYNDEDGDDMYENEGEAQQSGISKVIAMKKMRLMHLNRVREKDGGSKRRSRIQY